MNKDEELCWYPTHLIDVLELNVGDKKGMVISLDDAGYLSTLITDALRGGLPTYKQEVLDCFIKDMQKIRSNAFVERE
ncbi:MAG: hypothetical protein WC554_11035 [Clostridia bacterium]|jgi:hypothetical protein